ncbi:MAG: glycohydrolase toxin TNT-related protein [Roseomonas sp.]|nr:glycohydrolase toxin TNT-related protein [Roseomonas sp.]
MEGRVTPRAKPAFWARGPASRCLVLLAALAMGACAQPLSAPPQPQAWLRQDVAPRWLNADGSPRYPTAEDGFWQGFNEAPVVVMLPPGTLLDRFGGEEQGHYLAPLGAQFQARALPFPCAAAPYRS